MSTRIILLLWISCKSGRLTRLCFGTLCDWLKREILGKWRKSLWDGNGEHDNEKRCIVQEKTFLTQLACYGIIKDARFPASRFLSSGGEEVSERSVLPLCCRHLSFRTITATNYLLAHLMLKFLFRSVPTHWVELDGLLFFLHIRFFNKSNLNSWIMHH